MQDHQADPGSDSRHRTDRIIPPLRDGSSSINCQATITQSLGAKKLPGVSTNPTPHHVPSPVHSRGVATQQRRLLELLNSFPALELLFYFHVEISPEGIGSHRIEPVAFIREWRVGIEDVVNAKG